MRTFTAITLGRLIRFSVRTLKLSGGSAAPGLYGLKLDPNLVSNLSKKIPAHVIITGTNGKTTTSRLLAYLAKQSGLNVIRNQAGSNMERGIASALISGYTLKPKPYNLGIWELDEAAFNSVAGKINPEIIVFLNVFRDQLDRYGEINSVLKRWCETLKNLSPETIVLINGDDNNTNKLADFFKGKVYKFGLSDYKISGESKQENSQKLDFEARNIKTKGLSGSSFQLSINNKLLTINLPIPGIYHIYDATAALAAAQLLKLPVNKLVSSLKQFSPAFGRVEKLPFGYMFLIKNPAGAGEVFKTIKDQLKKEDRLLLALNDNIADGTDVSWIWDAAFEKLLTINSKLLTICSGSRAYDLTVRLKYAGFPVNSIHIEPDLKKALKEAQKGLKGKLYILPTYTAMLKLQKILTKAKIKKNYWEEES